MSGAAPVLGRFRAVTFAQSFHWLNRPRVARLVRDVLEPGGACVIRSTRRAGRGTRPPRERPGDDTMLADHVVLAGAGFSGPMRRKRQFEQELRALLRRASPGGRFCEQPRDSVIEIWRWAP